MGVHEAEVGDELESAEDYERAYRQQEDYVDRMLSVRKDLHDKPCSLQNPF